MGCCCGGDADDKLDPKSDASRNYQSMEGAEGNASKSPIVSVFATPSETRTPRLNNLKLPSTDNGSNVTITSSVAENGWTEAKTDKLEHELEKEIMKRKYTEDSKDEKLIRRLQSLDDQAGSLSMISNTEDSDHEVGDQERGPMPAAMEKQTSESANLFRIDSKSKASWDAPALDEQAHSMEEEIQKLSKVVGDGNET